MTSQFDFMIYLNLKNLKRSIQILIKLRDSSDLLDLVDIAMLVETKLDVEALRIVRVMYEND